MFNYSDSGIDYLVGNYSDYRLFQARIIPLASAFVPIINGSMAVCILLFRTEYNFKRSVLAPKTFLHFSE